MPQYTEDQKKIALVLLHEPKTIEELNKQLNIPYDKIQKEIKDMLKLKVITQGGYPSKYALKEEIATAVRMRKENASEDKFKLRLKIIIEAQAIEDTLLKKKMGEIKGMIEKEKDFRLYDIYFAPLIKQDENYATYLEINLSVKDFRALARLLFFYGPSTIEIISPEKLELTADELQDGLVDMADMIHNYNNYIASKMNLEELENFNKSLFG
ncbi:MAG: hypothetical protein ABID38_05650 [Candidatus Diapherotrites archaeon]